jgi:hypothetical protein
MKAICTTSIKHKR